MENNGLKKELGFWEAVTLVVGMVIGSGIFFKPSIVFKNAGTIKLGLLAWLIGGLITLAAGLTVAEIASAIPKTGGLFVYLKELYGEKWAFLFGWVETFVYVPASSAALAIIFSTQATFFLNLNNLGQKFLAISLILIILVINIISAKFGGRLQIISTVAKLLPIILIVVCGFTLGTVNTFTFPKVLSSGTVNFSAAILGTLWAYDGWISVANIAGELKSPEKNLPKSIILGLGTVIIVYLFFNFALIHVLPFNSILSSSKPASDASVLLFGNVGASLISIGILISILGALNGYFMTGARIPFAMAQDKLLPFHKTLGNVNHKFRTPLNSLILEFVLASIYVLTGSFNQLTDLSVFVLWIFFTMAIFGVFILRRKNILSKYKVPLFPLTPIIGIAGGLYILINTIISNTSNALLGLLISVLGLPFYLYLKKSTK